MNALDSFNFSSDMSGLSWVDFLMWLLYAVSQIHQGFQVVLSFPCKIITNITYFSYHGMYIGVKIKSQNLMKATLL